MSSLVIERSARAITAVVSVSALLAASGQWCRGDVLAVFDRLCRPRVSGDGSVTVMVALLPAAMVPGCRESSAGTLRVN